MKKTILTALLVAATAAQAEFSSTHVELTGAVSELMNNTIYDVSESRTISAEAGSSALTVEDGCMVAIYIKKGKTLTVNGGNATGATGAGAAIRVKPGATLYLLGEGTLVANGGAAGIGSNGVNGKDGYVVHDPDHGRAGHGGVGGSGGGGGAAAIGGVGGNGGAGGAGGEGEMRNCSGMRAFFGNGQSGSVGSPGNDGEGMGKVVILGRLTVRATAGAAASSDGQGGASGALDSYKWSNEYVGGGGGGGGGGARGQVAQYGIGGGGAGGAGGGGGGSGGTTANHLGGKETAWGEGGKGGKSYCGTAGKDGVIGGDKKKQLTYGTAEGGDGGAGGSANYTHGDGGTLVIGPSVQLGSSPGRASNTPLSPIASGLCRTTLHFISEGDEVGTATARLMLSMPAMPDVTRNGHRLLGFFTEESGGICVYGPDGTVSSPVWESVEESVSLYAHWEVAPTMLVVNTNEDGENLGDGKVTLRDAVRSLCADAMLCGTSGVRRIDFALPDEDAKNVIVLTNAIEAAAGLATFEIDGFNNGRGVTLTMSSGDFNLLRLSGSDVRLSSINFRGCQMPDVVHSNGFLMIENCSFIGNKGAVACGEDGSLVAMSCTFADNESAGSGGAVLMSADSVVAAFVNCTFSRNKSSDGSAVASKSAPLFFIHCTLVPGDENALVSASGLEVAFLNTLIARPSGGEAVTAGQTTSVCSSLGTQEQSDILETIQADDFLGVRHVWYEPVQSSASGNRDAAVVLYDYRLENIAIVTNGVTEAICGNAGLATMQIGIDQLHTARMAPVRGSIRIATGSQPPSVNIEGIAWGLTNATVEAKASVLYDDGTSDKDIPLTLKTNPNAAFGASVEVDGSDLYTHNVTSVNVEGLPGDDISMAVTTSPYALVASSASAIVTDESEVYMPGDNVRVTTARADSLVVTNLLVGGESFSAGSLAGFRDITLDDVNMRGGALRFLGSKTSDGGSQMANLAGKTIGGGDDEYANSLNDDSVTWTARYDGFVQVRLESGSTPSSVKVGLTVGGVEVTPLAGIGAKKRTPVWTVPVRKGETVTLKATGATVGYKTQFIYFGVKE